MKSIRKNIDERVVRDFGSEWDRFDQAILSPTDREKIFSDYFHLFPWNTIPSNAVGADIGCGSGRWASLVAPRVGHLYLVDPSNEAIKVARRNLHSVTNVTFHHESVGSLTIEECSLDFAYSLGVLHHVPDTDAAIKAVVRLLKPGAPFLIYLYYSFDNRPWSYRALWKVSDLLRSLISRMPQKPKHFICELIALFLYLPLARLAAYLDKIGILPDSWPLSYYKDCEYYVMRTDALDRFGTRLEKRFSRREIERILADAGLVNILFSNTNPFWCAVAVKRQIYSP